MEFYWILIWIAITAAISFKYDFTAPETVMGRTVYRYNRVWTLILIFPLVLLTANRSNVGDTYNYIKGFAAMPESLSELGAYTETLSKDEGFYIFSALIRILITRDVKVYFFILAAIQALLLFSVYRKYSTNLMVTFFLFIASTDYISWMYNGIRQFLAVTITFACLPLLLKKKYVPAILLCLLSSTIHGTALLVIPFFFVVNGKAWNGKTLLFLLGVMTIVVFVDRFTPLLDNLLQETQYENVVSDWRSWGDDGTNIFRVVVYSVPMILSVIGLRFIREADNPVINLSVNMSIISTGFYIISMFTSGIFIGRLPIYFSLYNYILLPWEIKHMFNKESSRLVYGVMVAAYLAFYVYSVNL